MLMERGVGRAGLVWAGQGVAPPPAIAGEVRPELWMARSGRPLPTRAVAARRGKRGPGTKRGSNVPGEGWRSDREGWWADQEVWMEGGEDGGGREQFAEGWAGNGCGGKGKWCAGGCGITWWGWGKTWWRRGKRRFWGRKCGGGGYNRRHFCYFCKCFRILNT